MELDLDDNPQAKRWKLTSELDRAKGLTPRVRAYCIKHGLNDIPDLDKIWKKPRKSYSVWRIGKMSEELEYVKEWGVPSNSGGKPHIIKLRSDGRLSCDCRCWIYNIKKSGTFYIVEGKIWSSRDCSHLHNIPTNEILEVFVSVADD